MKHYHAIAGMHGCMPNYNSVHTVYGEAVDDLVSLHELGNNWKLNLRRDGYLELKLKKHGNEYCEITECECDEC